MEGYATSSVSTYMTDQVEIFKSAMIYLDQVGPKSLVKTVLMCGTKPMLQAIASTDDGSYSNELGFLGMVKDPFHLIDGLKGSILQNALLNFT